MIDITRGCDKINTVSLPRHHIERVGSHNPLFLLYLGVTVCKNIWLRLYSYLALFMVSCLTL